MEEEFLNKLDSVLQKFDDRLDKLERQRINQQQILPNAVLQSHIQGWIVFSGTAASRPTDGSTQAQVWWSTDTHVLSIWDSTAKVWRTVTLA